MFTSGQSKFLKKLEISIYKIPYSIFGVLFFEFRKTLFTAKKLNVIFLFNKLRS